ncbi:MAG: SpaH/EbpB family LPXTG-anchored major pilin [Actinobacteria bacterium]|nr:SpaH/EbpB family LPXTG-anchored major pilin [Actinomycetota bacterium]
MNRAMTMPRVFSSRAILALLLGAVLALAAAIGGLDRLLLPLSTAPAHADAPLSSLDPHAPTELVIHKLLQPQQYGAPATGLPISTSGLTPVAGVTFTAKRVPGIDLTTSTGWDAARALTLSQAAAAVQHEPVAGTGVTGASGQLSLPLTVGLFYVEETGVPNGTVAGAPFLVTLPLPHPTANHWLYTVHVYPKNARVSASLAVDDATAVKLGDTVTWTSSTAIPHQKSIDGYVVQNLIDPRLKLIDSTAQVRVELPGHGALVPGTDYVTRIITIGGKQAIEVEFTAAGRQKLAHARDADPDAQVKVSYRTSALSEGELVNEVRLLPDAKSIAGAPGGGGPVKATAVTKWGPLTIKVHERGKPEHLIPGATFKLYLTPEDALAKRNPITVDGVSEWTTGENGEVTIHGLRFSGFANGLDRNPSDPLFRYYYAMPTSFPKGWTGVKEPLQATVRSTSEAQVLTVVLWRSHSDKDPGRLPTTGAQIAGGSLLGGVLLGLGVLVLARRRRREDA